MANEEEASGELRAPRQKRDLRSKYRHSEKMAIFIAGI